MKAVNLLSRGAKPPGTLPAAWSLVAVALVLLTGVLVTALVYAHAENRAAKNDAQLASLRRQLALAEVAREQLAASPADDSASGLRSAVIAALEGRAQWGGLLRGVGRVMPPGAWLTKLTLGEPGVSAEGGETSAPPPVTPTAGVPGASAGQMSGGTALSLVGCALNQSLVGRLVSGLGRLPGASEVSVSSKQTGQGSSCGEHPSFQLSFSLSGSAS